MSVQVKIRSLRVSVQVQIRSTGERAVHHSGRGRDDDQAQKYVCMCFFSEQMLSLAAIHTNL